MLEVHLPGGQVDANNMAALFAVEKRGLILKYNKYSLEYSATESGGSVQFSGRSKELFCNRYGRR